MNKKAKKLTKLRYNIIIIILCLLLLSLSIYIAYDKYFGPIHNWFNYQENHILKLNCDEDLKKAIEAKELEKKTEFSKILTTYNEANELIKGENLLSPYVDVKLNDLKLSCQKIQKDLLTIYFSPEIINTLLNTSTLNNEFVNCIIKDTNENYGPRNVFSNSIFSLDSQEELIPLAYEKNYYLTSLNNNFIIFEKTNDVWKIKQY